MIFLISLRIMIVLNLLYAYGIYIMENYNYRRDEDE
jgi:hypothetical protein